ncbi:uncharacterized protein LOC129307179 [Prosopis cineraria]|uniref:uncharacterized protein LOC129307179 n=1 Tax=Prosopis cineraria TaxID=364024 RepID=UPI00240F477F|nr:uncharacterized protein LOC129307179 [Prosopis cineraria]
MKKQSVLVRLLLGFLCVINALGHSSATDILGQKENQKELVHTRVGSMFSEKEAQYHVSRKLGFGRKKSMEIHDHKDYSSMDFSVKEKGSERGGLGTTKISAEDNNALKNSIGSLREDDHQKDDKNVANSLSESKTNYSNYAKVKTRLKKSSFSRPERQISEESQEHKEKDEEKTERIFQVEEEVMSFMRKDYNGMAHRKPPINNQEPRN